MKLSHPSVDIRGLNPVMRKAMKVAERLWIEEGELDGITITAGLDGVHSAGSWHYSGCAVDIRNRYWDEAKRIRVHAELKRRLPDYDIVLHSTHVHMEPSDRLAQKCGLMI